MLMASSHEFPLFVGMPFRSHLAHDGAGLSREIMRRAYQYHGLDSARLLRGHVQEGLCPHAHADGFELVNLQLVKQCEYVERRLPKGELQGWIGRSSVASKVRRNQPVILGRIIEDERPVGADPGPAVQ